MQRVYSYIPKTIKVISVAAVLLLHHEVRTMLPPFSISEVRG